jgi:ABC-type spermidine/putrescine transport system permease subunit II
MYEGAGPSATPLTSIRTAAGLLVFTLSLDEIAVTFFLIGRQNTLPLLI